VAEAGAWLPYGLMSSPAGIVADPAYRPWQGTATETVTHDGAVQYVIHDAFGATETITFGPDRFRWVSDDGDYDITGTFAAPGSAWLHPWRTPEGTFDEMYYQAHDYEVSGTLHGKPVSGFMHQENMWGNQNYFDTWWVQNRAGTWTYWANKYDDGTIESGNFLCGEYGARGAIVTNSKGQEVLNTTRINATARPQADGIHTDVDFTIGDDGEQWEFVVNPQESLPVNAIGIGEVRRKNETRKIVDHHAVYLISNDQTCDPLPDGVAAARRTAPHRAAKAPPMGAFPRVLAGVAKPGGDLDKQALWGLDRVRSPKVPAGEPVGPAIQLLEPWRGRDGATHQRYRVIQWYRAGTTYKPVEHAWADTPARPPKHHEVTWLNQYRDGSVEYGVFRCGPSGRVAFVTDAEGNELLNTGDVTATARRGRIRYNLGGQRWTLDRRSGILRRAGDRRAVTAHRATASRFTRGCKPAFR
jgi:hypothetical protein